MQLHSLAEDYWCVGTLRNHHSAVTGLDFSKRTLAIASTDGTISLCTPGDMVSSDGPRSKRVSGSETICSPVFTVAGDTHNSVCTETTPL